MTDSYEDRRQSPRIDRLHLVQISRFDEEGFRSDLATGRTLNISRGGIRLELYHALPLRTVVSLHLVLDEHIIEVGGIVAYLEVIDDERCAMGIEFRDLSDEDDRRLAAYVEQNC